jgi:hypothetical protein
MKNNRFENNYYENNRYENYSDNNAYRRAAVKKKQSRAPLALAIISLVLVSLLLASTVWLICVQINHRDKAQPAAVTATISQNNALPKSATPAAEKTAEPRKCGRMTLSVMTFLFGAYRYGTFLTFLPFLGNTLRFSPLLARRHLTRAYGRLTSCRERRKRVSAVIARKLYGYFFSAVSLLS